MRGSAAHQTKSWMIALTEYGFMAGENYIMNSSDCACACAAYYTRNFRIGGVFGELLSRLPLIILDFFG